jgi:hypothetical protein
MKKALSFILTAFVAGLIFIIPAQAWSAGGNVPTTEELACIQTAITTRDDAIITAYDAYAVSAKAALTARKDALKTAWAKGSVPEITTAVSDVWKTYRKSIVTARIALRRAKIQSWKQYKTDKAACFTKNEPGVDTTDVQADAQL